MTQAILALGLELRRRQPKLGEPEVRVVAESTGTARRLEDVSLPHALRMERRRVPGTVQVDERAAVAGAARLERYALQGGHELGVIGRIHGGRILRSLARITRRVDARRAAERVDL